MTCSSAMRWATGCCWHCGYQSLDASLWMPAVGMSLCLPVLGCLSQGIAPRVPVPGFQPPQQPKQVLHKRHLAPSPSSPPTAPFPSRRGGGCSSPSPGHIFSARRQQLPVIRVNKQAAVSAAGSLPALLWLVSRRAGRKSTPCLAPAEVRGCPCCWYLPVCRKWHRAEPSRGSSSVKIGKVPGAEPGGKERGNDWSRASPGEGLL